MTKAMPCGCVKYHEDDCPERPKPCEKCNGTGIVEVYGGSDADEWDVIDTKPCDCQE